jgi:hypothetical protein
MFVNLFAFWRAGIALRIPLLDVRLQPCYLLVDIGNILFDNKGEFLNPQSVYM